MLITRIELENIKSYHHVAVDLRSGTTAICGANGAGKTTLVEAIGYTLFDYLPYKQDQFVREGEKYGKVIIHLIGSDERPYIVERRCGAGTRWFIHDVEASFNVDQRKDVLDKLHELFGIDHERPLDSLFRDALGVPQGTFTSIFLEPASKRKQTFDALLQIEDYKTASDYLLEPQKLYKEQKHMQELEIQRLQYETRELEDWRYQLKEARTRDEQEKQQNAEWSEQLKQCELRSKTLQEQFTKLQLLKQRYDSSQTEYKHAREKLDGLILVLQNAQTAQQLVQTNQPLYQRYQQAEKELERLRVDEQQRNTLRKQQFQLRNNLAKIEASMNNWHDRLQDVAQARKNVVTLEPLVQQQQALESQRDEWQQKSARYDAIVIEGKRLVKQQDGLRQKQEGLQRSIADIEPLVPLAELLAERSERLTQLRIQSSERTTKLQQLHEKRAALQEKQNERQQSAEKLRSVEQSIERIEKHRQKAEEMPVLQEEYASCTAQVHRLEGNIEGYKKSRAQSVGGQCPFLHESCLNIKQRGMVSLESYFDTLLQEEHTLLSQVRIQQEALNEHMTQLQKYVDALNSLGKYVERRDSMREHLQRIAVEEKRLERDVEGLQQLLDEFKQVDQQLQEIDKAYNESKQADSKVRELAGFYKQVQQLQEQVQSLDTSIQERRQEAETLRGSEAQLRQVDLELKKLNDPRAQKLAQEAIIVQEDYFQRKLHEEQQKEEQVQAHLQKLEGMLSAYDTLDSAIAEQELLRQQCQEGYQTYLKNIDTALTLATRQSEHQQQQRLTTAVEEQLHAVEQDYQQARTNFNEQDLITVQQQIEQLNNDLKKLAWDMKKHQEEMSRLEEQIAAAELLLVQLETAQQEYQALEDLGQMMEHFRKLIKEAAPHVLKAMLADISAESNRIFGEIMGDRSAHLSWEKDYEVVLRRQGVNRTFAQLSGGEQMSAALAVRLALLKKLSTLNIAFFDEPTQNMDELRRMNLAEQIKRVRGFDQLIVISHDDTFEQGLDSILRLRKEHNETHVLDDDGVMGQREQVDIYAS